ncbi:MAG: DUF4307 domain-containing protein [Burkholderiaceae bacterium]|nr:DUF4307 domain-containing protein [Microbacteriaceae bacterium]
MTDVLDPGIDERYGRTPSRRRATQRFAWVAAIGFAVVLVAWVVWGGLDNTSSGVDAVDTQHSVIDSHSVSVGWQITMAAGQSAKCAIQAQNEAHSIVGWRIVDVPPSDQRTRAFSAVVSTAELAVTGLIYRCWLT